MAKICSLIAVTQEEHKPSIWLSMLKFFNNVNKPLHLHLHLPHPVLPQILGFVEVVVGEAADFAGLLGSH